jgi:hypothetical protein
LDWVTGLSLARALRAQAGDGPTYFCSCRVFEKLISEICQFRIIRTRPMRGHPLRHRQVSHLPKWNFQIDQKLVVDPLLFAAFFGVKHSAFSTFDEPCYRSRRADA